MFVFFVSLSFSLLFLTLFCFFDWVMMMPNQPPFALFPGEELEKPVGKNAIQPLEVIHTDKAINLLCLDDIVDEKGEKRLAGEEYQLLGPIVYFVIEPPILFHFFFF